MRELLACVYDNLDNHQRRVDTFRTSRPFADSVDGIAFSVPVASQAAPGSCDLMFVDAACMELS